MSNDFDLFTDDAEAKEAPTPEYQVMNDYLVIRGAHEPEYPGGPEWGMLPGSDAEPLCNLAEVDGYLDEYNPAVAELVRKSREEGWDNCAENIEHIRDRDQNPYRKADS